MTNSRVLPSLIKIILALTAAIAGCHSLIQRLPDPKRSAGAVTAFVKSHLLLSETKVIKCGKPLLLGGTLDPFGQYYTNFGHI